MLVLFVACAPAETPDGGGGGGGGGWSDTDGGGLTGGGAGGTALGGGEGGGGAPLGGGEPLGGGAPSGGGGEAGGGDACAGVAAGTVPELAGKAATPLATAPDWTNGASYFLEGPVWADGALYLSQLRTYGNQPPSRILRLNGANLEPFFADAGTNGLAWDGTRLLGASHQDFGIVAFTLEAPVTKTLLVGRYGDAGFNSPNDLAVRADGNLYFSDPSYQCGSNCPQGAEHRRVYRVAPDGGVTTLPTQHHTPNGISLSPDQQTLYVAGSGPIEQYALSAEGAPGPRQQLADVRGVDGMAIDCAGNVYAAVGAQQVLRVITPAGTVLPDAIPVSGVSPTNAAFGGPARTTLYVTTFGNGLRAVELDVPGLPY